MRSVYYYTNCILEFEKAINKVLKFRSKPLIKIKISMRCVLGIIIVRDSFLDSCVFVHRYVGYRM